MGKKARVLLIAACACAAMAAFVLFGCSSGSEPAPEPAQPAAEQTTESSEAQAEQESTEAETSEAAEDSSSAPATEDPVELQLFAANSLSEAMNAVQELYTQDHPWVTFADTQYEGSGTLNELLGAGSYADALITASKSTMDTAVEEGYVDETTRFDMFKNDLVIVGGEASDLTDVALEDLATGEYTLAVGDANVPAGAYAKQALSTTDPACWIAADGATGSETNGKEGTFDGTPLEGKVTEGSSVGNVCSYANSGDVDCAIVYSSDVYRYGGVKVLSAVPADTHKPIVYPAAVCTVSENAEAVEEFLDWAYTDKAAQQVWQEYGFELA
ncbi:molybdate ABC transporter substrate-binding protein [Xiamenia xianingshaonis]|uniref:Extracellular solute-binding protein n=1 Tax=Xiamenia xianingshaonis TaxID=2682776 RepID=A0A9E6SUP3_9ACTN|nr:extracellular solute-binding protein [Xiamenia xianingshaonis]NHM13212.1 extracellular solute-binding protein [Xiamenia xianingshaonis]QTU84698.1 extracellular solute-binding protein [Xiamenia xianingshaonis]